MQQSDQVLEEGQRPCRIQMRAGRDGDPAGGGPGKVDKRQMKRVLEKETVAI